MLRPVSSIRLLDLSPPRDPEAAPDAPPPASLLQAAALGDRESVAHLTQVDPAALDAVDDDGNTALHVVARQAESRQHRDDPEDAADAHCAIAHHLIGQGMRIDATNRHLETPLHLAASHSRPDMLRLLLQHGANLVAVDSRGDTVLHRIAAAPAGADRMLDAIGDSGQPLPFRVRNHAGLTPAEVARESGKDPEFIRCLEPAEAETAPSPQAAAPSRAPWLYTWNHVCGTIGSLQKLDGHIALWHDLRRLAALWPSYPADSPPDLSAQMRKAAAWTSADGVHAALEALRALRAAAPTIDAQHPAALAGLYASYAEMLLRAGHHGEAIDYASCALRMARAHAVTEVASQAAQTLDQTEWEYIVAALERDYGKGEDRPEVTAIRRWQRNFMAVVERCKNRRLGLAAGLAEATRSLQDLLDYSRLMEAYDLPAQAHTMRASLAQDPAALRLANDLVAEIDARLSVLYNTPGQSVPLQAIADAVPDFAEGLARLGLPDLASACCSQVRIAALEVASRYGSALDCGRAAELEASTRLTVLAAQQLEPVGTDRAWRHLSSLLAALRNDAQAAIALLPLPAATDPLLAQWETRLPVEQLLQTMSRRYEALVDHIVRITLARILSAPPCRFCVLGLGSFARRDMTLHSDFEYVVLVERNADQDPAILQWFVTFLSRFDFHIRLLGESHPGNAHPLPPIAGFHIDPGIASTPPNGRILSVDTILAQRHGQADASMRARIDPDVLVSLMSPALAYGDKALFDDYRASLADTGSRDLAAALALRQMANDIDRFRRAPPAAPGRGDAERARDCRPKPQILLPLICSLSQWTLILRSRHIDMASILLEVSGMGLFAPEFARQLRWSLATTHTIRLLHQLEHQAPQEEIRRNALPPQQRVALNRIEQCVVRPLLALLAARLPKQGMSEPEMLAWLRAARKLDPLLVGLPAPGAPLPAQPVSAATVQNLAQSFAIRISSAGRMVHYYRLSLAGCTPDDYPERWRIWQQALVDRPDRDACLGRLAMTPARDGWRALWHESEQQFRAGLRHWFTDPDADTSGVRVEYVDWDDLPPLRAGSPGTRVHIGTLPLRQSTLRAEVADALLRKDGVIRPKLPDTGGRHTLLPVELQVDGKRRCWWVKVYPENAGMDMLVHCLDRRINGGLGTLPSWLFVLHCTDGRVPIQVFEEVGGQRLSHAMRTRPAVLDRISPSSFTRTLLRALLTNPEDDKDDDYFLCQHPMHGDGLLLRRIDNERAFFAPYEVGWLKRQRLQVKSMLYCLNQMERKLDSSTLAEFATLSGPELVHAWLHDALMLHRVHRSLFPTSLVQESFARPLPCLLTVGIADGLEEQLLDRIETLQGIIALARGDRSAISGFELLLRSQHAIAAHYSQAFRRYPIDSARPELAANRFLWLTDHGYVSMDGVRRTSMAGVTALTKGLDMRQTPTSADLADIHEGRRRSPAQALQRLSARASVPVTRIVEDLVAGRHAALQDLSRLSVRQKTAIINDMVVKLRQQTSAYSIARQQELLRLMAGIPFLELSLSPFSEALTDDLLLPLIRSSRDSLWRLDLSGCGRLTIHALMDISRECTGLKVLQLRNMWSGQHRGLPRSLRKPGFSFGSLAFPVLKRLDLSGNPWLEEIELGAPALMDLNLQGCRHLRDVRIGASALRRLDASECSDLADHTLAALTRDWAKAAHVDLAGCRGIGFSWFRQRHPWMAGSRIGLWSAMEVWQLDRAISEVVAANGGLAPEHFRRQCIDWADWRVRHAWASGMPRYIYRTEEPDAASLPGVMQRLWQAHEQHHLRQGRQPKPDAVIEWIGDLLQHSEPALVAAGLQLLDTEPYSGEVAEAAIPQLRACLAHPDGEIAVRAACLLHARAAADSESLTQVLRDRLQRFSYSSFKWPTSLIEAAARIGLGHDPSLAKRFRDAVDHWLRWKDWDTFNTWANWEYGRATVSDVAMAVLRWKKYPSSAVEIGLPTASAVVPLFRRLGQEDAGAVADALLQCMPGSFFPDPGPVALIFTQWIVDFADSAMPQLMAALSDGNADVQMAALIGYRHCSAAQRSAAADNLLGWNWSAVGMNAALLAAYLDALRAQCPDRPGDAAAIIAAIVATTADAAVLQAAARAFVELGIEEPALARRLFRLLCHAAADAPLPGNETGIRAIGLALVSAGHAAAVVASIADAKLERLACVWPQIVEVLYEAAPSRPAEVTRLVIRLLAVPSGEAGTDAETIVRSCGDGMVAALLRAALENWEAVSPMLTALPTNTSAHSMAVFIGVMKALAEHRMDRAISSLTGCMLDASGMAAIEAGAAVLELVIDAGPSAHPLLVPLLRSPYGRIRTVARVGLAAAGSQYSSMAPFQRDPAQTLLHLVRRREDELEQCLALAALRFLHGRAAQPAGNDGQLPALHDAIVGALGARAHLVRFMAISTIHLLFEMGPQYAAAITTQLARAAADAHEEVRLEALQQAREFRALDWPIMQSAIRNLSPLDSLKIREAAIRVLAGAGGVQDRTAAPIHGLVARLAGSDARSRAVAISALAELAEDWCEARAMALRLLPAGGLPQLMKAAPTEAMLAIDALKRIGPALLDQVPVGTDAVPTSIGLLDMPSHRVLSAWLVQDGNLTLRRAPSDV